MQRRAFLNTALSAASISIVTPFTSDAGAFDDFKIISTNPNHIRRGNLPKVKFSTGGPAPQLGHSYNIVRDPTGSAPTRKVERFELRYRDYWENEGKSDKHRIEVGTGVGGIQYGDEHLYEWNFFIEEDFLQGIDDTCHVFGNVHDFSSVHKHQTNHLLTIHGYRPNVYRLSASIYNGRKREIHTIAKYREIVDRWVNVKWHVKWSENGFHRYWIDGVSRYEYSGFTLHSQSPSDTIRMNYGLYRGSVSKWEKSNGKKEQPKKMLVSGFKRSSVS